MINKITISLKRDSGISKQYKSQFKLNSYCQKTKYGRKIDIKQKLFNQFKKKIVASVSFKITELEKSYRKRF